MSTQPEKRPVRLKPRHVALAAGTAALLLIIALLLTPAIAPLFLYLPTHDEEARAALLAREDVEELQLESGGAILRGYFLRGSNGPAPLILSFYGNHENASAFMQELATTPERLAVFSGCHFAQFDYPSYGLSTGKPDGEAYRQMALDAYDALIAREDVTEIIVMGYSIGTGPAHFCAASRSVSGLMLLAPYADGIDLFNNVIPVFHGPLVNLVCYDMPSIDYAAQITVSPLVFATPGDHLVPYESTLRLTEVYPAGCRFVTVPGIDHKGFLPTPAVLEEMAAYVQEAVGGS